MDVTSVYESEVDLSLDAMEHFLVKHCAYKQAQCETEAGWLVDGDVPELYPELEQLLLQAFEDSRRWDGSLLKGPGDASASEAVPPEISEARKQEVRGNEDEHLPSRTAGQKSSNQPQNAFSTHHDNVACEGRSSREYDRAQLENRVPSPCCFPYEEQHQQHPRQAKSRRLSKGPKGTRQRHAVR